MQNVSNIFLNFQTIPSAGLSLMKWMKYMLMRPVNREILFFRQVLIQYIPYVPMKNQVRNQLSISTDQCHLNQTKSQ